MNPLVPEALSGYIPNTIQLAYLLASVLFILGVKRLSSPATARSGNLLASLGMFIGVAVTLFDREIVSFQFIVAGIVIGSVIGAVLARRVKMTSMPELVSLFNGFGGAASAMVASGEYFRLSMVESPFVGYELVTMVISLFIGSLTFTGSLIAFGKLKGLIGGSPLVYAGYKVVNSVIFAGVLVCAVLFVLDADNTTYFLVIAGIALLLGILMVLPIGGADMPVVISLLNSLTGLAASATGFVLNNNLLIVSGTLVGAAGFILTMIMCKAMNRPLVNVLFGAFGSDASGGTGSSNGTGKSVKEVTAEDLSVMTAYAKRVVIVPGYGLAVAQAQHVIREVADVLESKGVDIRYGIHPVAGRMPGHMNVLLAEANVPYPQLFDMDEINKEFQKTDVVLVIGANDVVNPDARNNSGSPIYGMPILNVDEARSVVVFKRSLNPGFAGIDNQLFYGENSYMFFGDAKASLSRLLQALKEL
ncbi:NAD(P)(+) transhydrogenase (Re/Si-specific) subunit beta [Balneolales bacterium ANBcel1]|nr:NAD(P)(+) transhydrogenase (Re/Si-specific) subunit beta [Balneolales bacterium ANBcel1]